MVRRVGSDGRSTGEPRERSAGWRTAPLGDLIEMAQYGLSVRGERKGRCPILRMNCQDSGRVVMRDLQYADVSDRDLEQYRLRDRDLLFNRTNSYELVGRTAIYRGDGDVVFASYLLRLRVDERQILPEYLNFFLGSPESQATLKSFAARGVSQANISASKLRHLPVLVPPMKEQQEIASILDHLLDRVNASRRRTAAISDLKAATLAKLFNEGLRGEPLKQLDFGMAPESWSMTTLSDVAVVQTGVAKGRQFDDADVVEVPYLRVANVQDGHLDLSEMKTIEIRRAELDRYTLRDGDVVLTEGGDFDKLGRGFIWRSELPLCIHQNHVFAVRTDRTILQPEFFAYLAQSPYGKAYFLQVAHKTTNLACINSNKLKAFPIALPSLEEQQQIVSILGAIDQKLRVQQRKHILLDNLFQGLLHQLMTGEIRIKDLAPPEFSHA